MLCLVWTIIAVDFLFLNFRVTTCKLQCLQFLCSNCLFVLRNISFDLSLRHYFVIHVLRFNLVPFKASGNILSLFYVSVFFNEKMKF